MPANLPPQYYEAEKVYRQARTAAEKIEALENMLAIMPKHKGTDHLRGELRARLAKLTEEGERRQGAARSQLNSVRKEGAGQAVLVGPANSGKSQLLAALTGASPKVAEYPFTTRVPMPAMMPFENVQVQLVDLPAVVEHVSLPWLRPIIRQSDLLLVVVSLAEDPLSELESTLSELAAMRVELAGPGQEPGSADFVLRKRGLVVANKLDLPDAPDNLELLGLEYEGRYSLAAVSAKTGAGLEELKGRIFAVLDVVRVYTRAPGREPDFTQPVVLPRGSTVEDVAEAIHKEIREKLRYALLWGSGKFSGQRVGRQYVVEDGDVVELVS